jgi:hypothetical protein
VTIHRFHDVSLTDESDDRAVSSDDWHSADVVNEEQTNSPGDLLLCAHGDDALTIDDVSSVHFEPPDKPKGYS